MKVFPYKFVRVQKTEECSKKIKQLTFDIENATDFIKSIETGNLDAEYKGMIDTDNIDANSLPGSLISMRDQMKMIAEQEHERNWATEGIARFVEILRSNNDDITALSDKILSNLVKYLNANQGYLFILDDTTAEDKFLNLTACYAYNKRKYVKQRIEIGEGLIGQCFLEKETIYLTDVPAEYVKITSGLGESLPRNIIIVPLKLNDEVYGIVEMASFEVIKKYQVEFLEKLGESIASTIANVNVNERTKRLLGDAQLMAEQLRSQEEEMRQNMEELSATQEEMQRRQAELNEANGRFDLVNKSSSEGLWEINYNNNTNANGDTLIWFSEQFFTLIGYRQDEFPGKLSSWVALVHPDDKERVLGNFSAHINDITNKTLYDVDYRMKVKTGEYRWFKSRGTTMRDENGNPLRVAGALKDVHEEKMAFEKVQLMLEEIKDKEDYMNNVINATSDTIYTIDRGYKIVTFNKAFSETISAFGFKIEKGTDVFHAFGEVQDNAESKLKYDKVLTGESVDESIEHAGFHFNIKYNPIRNANDEIIGISVFSKDVTVEMKLQLETQKQTAEIKEKEAYVNSVINATAEMIITLDREYKIVATNEAAVQIFGKQGIHFTKGMNIFDIFTEEQKPLYKSYYDKVFAGENIEVIKEYFGHSYIMSYNPLRNDSGYIAGLTVFTKDITKQLELQKETEKLLASSQQQAEELKAQEEELRQNMEELSATQDEMQNVLKDVQEKEQYLSELINVSSDSIYTVDRDYKLLSFNRKLINELEALGMKAAKGFNMLQFFEGNDAEKKKSQAIYDRAFNGESFTITSDFDVEGNITYHMLSYAPLRNENGEIIAVAAYTKEVTETVIARKKTEELLAASQQQAEELKAQEEELRQNMEELSATQEDIQRYLLETQEQEAYMNSIINSSTDSIVTVDRNMKVINCNDTLKASYAGYGLEISKGFDLTTIFTTAEEKNKYLEHYNRVFKGETFDVVEHYVFGAIDTYFSVKYSPLKSKKGEIIAAACFASDVTALVTSQKDTEKLLVASQQQAEELKAQEEELRQNMEELSATQEEMQKTLHEVHEKEQYLDELINVPKDSIFTLDRELRILSYNKAFSLALEAMGFSNLKGFAFMDLYTDPAEKQKQIAYYDRAFKGENFEALSEYENAGIIAYYTANYAPLYDKRGEIFAVACFTKDVTAIVTAQKETERLLAASQQQAEELKAQEEELRQNMEELAATQEEMERKKLEIEEVRMLEKERADNQVLSQKKLMEQFIAKAKQKEDTMAAKIRELEERLSGIPAIANGKEVHINGQANGHAKAPVKA